MAIPVVYNIRSVQRRWTSSLVAVLGVAGTVAVFVAMLALARGFQATIVSSGLPDNAIVQQAGSDSEMTSAVLLEDTRAISDLPQVARKGAEPLISPEVVVIAALPMRGTGTDANVQVRGVSERVLAVRDNVKLVEGRFLKPGLAEVVIGKGARAAYQGLDLGATVKLGAGAWTIVGVFDGQGSAFDSEVWADAGVLNGFYQRPPSIYQSLTVRLRSAGDFAAFESGLIVETGDRVPSTDYARRLAEVPGLGQAVRRLGVTERSDPAVLASAFELVLEGLHLSRRINKDKAGAATVYRR